jgi:hypothetical protein
MQLVNVPTLNRQININPSGAITCTDNYRIVNNSTQSIAAFEFDLPTKASKITARDDFGRALNASNEGTTSTTQASSVTFATAINPGETAGISLDYSLPSVSPQASAKFALSIDKFPYFSYYVDSASVTINPPEGAKITVPDFASLGSSSDLTRFAFQETFTVNSQGVSYLDSLNPSENELQVVYEYNSLWIAFRPTSWMWAAAVVGCVVVAIWTRPRAKGAPARMEVSKAAAGLTQENIVAFTSAYEERNRIVSELQSLEARAQRGRIPRRRYKVQRKTWEMRLETLSRNIAGLKELFNRAGGSYADIARQLEIAEVELEEVQVAMKNLDTRHDIGELPMGEYRNQLSDLERRKKKAESAVNGLLLRLREEIR